MGSAEIEARYQDVWAPEKVLEELMRQKILVEKRSKTRGIF